MPYRSLARRVAITLAVVATAGPLSAQTTAPAKLMGSWVMDTTNGSDDHGLPKSESLVFSPQPNGFHSRRDLGRWKRTGHVDLRLRTRRGVDDTQPDDGHVVHHSPDGGQRPVHRGRPEQRADRLDGARPTRGLAVRPIAARPVRRNLRIREGDAPPACICEAAVSLTAESASPACQSAPRMASPVPTGDRRVARRPVGD